MRRLSIVPSVFFLLGVGLIGCSESKTPDSGKKDSSNTTAPTSAGTLVTLQVEGMSGPGSGVRRAKGAVARLPWVDQKTVAVDISTKEVKFNVPDMTKFDKNQLLDEFNKSNFPKTTIVDPKLGHLGGNLGKLASGRRWVGP